MINTLVMILAGGKGERLAPLTRDRAKPAVPFGGRYRIIDFVLSNFINSGFFRIKVLTQYLSNSLLIHLNRGFNFGSMSEHYVDAIPAQQGLAETGWYAGTADAIYRNLNVIRDERPIDVAVFGGDHIYKMDIRQMLNHHRNRGASCTVAAVPFDRAKAAHNYGIIEVDAEWRITGFEEKPADPKPIPGMPDKALVSMGNYIFRTADLEDVLLADAADTTSAHDFGRNVIPAMIGKLPVYAYNFLDNVIPGELPAGKGYWRDVGTVDTFYDANMDLKAVTPQLNLYNYEWPIRTANLHLPPTKFVFNDEGRRGMAVDSLIANGSIISGSLVSDSIVFANVFVHSYAEIDQSILFGGCNIGRHVKLRRVICDKFVTMADGVEIGFDLEADRQRFDVTEQGIVVVPKGASVPKHGPLEFSGTLPPPGTMRARTHLPGSTNIGVAEAN